MSSNEPATVYSKRSSNEKPGGISPAMGCLGIVIIFAAIAGAGLIWLVVNGKTFFAEKAQELIVSMIEDSSIDEAEKQEMVIEIDRVKEAFITEAIDFEDLANIGVDILESPLGSILMAISIEMAYIQPSGLREEEKSEAHITLQRLYTSMLGKKLAEEDIEALFKIVTKEGSGNGNDRFNVKEQLTDEEIRRFLAEAKRLTDEAGIPATPQEIDFSEELKKIIDERLPD